MHSHIGYDLVSGDIGEGSKVLDLGCGDGVLLQLLQRNKHIIGFGVEISEDGVSKCVEKGLYCYHGDIDEGLSDYKNQSFDYVILNQTLQSTKKPEYVIKEIMRISNNAIISFPNYGYIKMRLQFLLTGKMPKNILQPYEWYETPDIHHLTINDFYNFCKLNNFNIKKVCHFDILSNGRSHIIKIIPNIYAQYGYFILDGESYNKSK